MERLKLVDRIGSMISRLRGTTSELKLRGRFHLEIIRNGQVLEKIDFTNTIMNAAKDSTFNVYFNDATKLTTWYIGLISTASYSAIAAGDTAASHAGWTEFTGYSEASRPAWTQGTASGQSITNASPVVFSINATGTLKGAFLISNNTKGGTSGMLFAAGLLPAGEQAVVSSDEIRITYTVNG